jgi:hypothetical protein
MHADTQTDCGPDASTYDYLCPLGLRAAREGSDE